MKHPLHLGKHFFKHLRDSFISRSSCHCHVKSSIGCQEAFHGFILHIVISGQAGQLPYLGQFGFGSISCCHLRSSRFQEGPDSVEIPDVLECQWTNDIALSGTGFDPVLLTQPAERRTNRRPGQTVALC